MPAYSVALPLTVDAIDGFTNIKDFGKLIRQNMKMLILTNPGERIMLPNFGLGLKKILFETKSGSKIILNNMETFGDNIEASGYYKNKLERQMLQYMSSVTLEFFEISTLSDSENSAVASVIYSVPSVSIYDSIIFLEKNGKIVTERMHEIQAENIMRLPKNSNIQKINAQNVTFEGALSQELVYFDSER
jgi:hypothetical protein